MVSTVILSESLSFRGLLDDQTFKESVLKIAEEPIPYFQQFTSNTSPPPTPPPSGVTPGDEGEAPVPGGAETLVIDDVAAATSPEPVEEKQEEGVPSPVSDVKSATPDIVRDQEELSVCSVQVLNIFRDDLNFYVPFYS